MKVLVTGFDPFGDDVINPSFEAVKMLPDVIDNAKIIKIEIPTVFYKSIEVLRKAIDKYQPDVVICVGQAGGRDKIAIERLAINIDDARIADNEGQKPIDKIIEVDGQNALFSTLPIKLIHQRLNEVAIPSEISNTAGTFVCNHLMYGLLSTTLNTKTRGGFIHVPYIPEQVVNTSIRSMTLEMITKALTIAISVSLQNCYDIKLGAGKIY